jgi:uncharacterized protein (DUF2147 family)
MIKCTFTVLLLITVHFCFAQGTILGKWKSIDDQTGEAKSIVEIFERGSKIYGKIIKVFPRGGVTDPVCMKCPPDDARFNQKILGMEIIKGLEAKGEEYEGGDILDPEVGKIYRCKIWLEDGKLKVRGYLGFLFRTQTWEKVQP